MLTVGRVCMFIILVTHGLVHLPPIFEAYVLYCLDAAGMEIPISFCDNPCAQCEAASASVIKAECLQHEGGE